MTAYRSGDYVTCLEKFAAFEAAGSLYLETHQQIAGGVRQRIEICRDQLNAALEYNRRARETNKGAKASGAQEPASRVRGSF